MHSEWTMSGSHLTVSLSDNNSDSAVVDCKHDAVFSRFVINMLWMHNDKTNKNNANKLCVKMHLYS